ncbi:hypothetical protein C5167_019877 [Papaver somniferum]|uniref:Uncharacterized protein n=1 Tax=Papaver somniferum TaxID=3469 RepID=A0A4Y7IVA9_PAPSO|nr:hypothetical protein C5167_019877 [Papaver somniferum]
MYFCTYVEFVVSRLVKIFTARMKSSKDKGDEPIEFEEIVALVVNYSRL